MNGKDLYNAIGGIDEKFIADADSARGKKTTRVAAFAPWLKWAAPLAACLVITVAIAMPAILNNQQGNPASGGGSPSADAGGANGGATDGNNNNFGNSVLVASSLDNIFGLPTNDYTWDGGEPVGAADRLETNELRYLMREFNSWSDDVLASFAIVKVESVEPAEIQSDYPSLGRDGQIAECGVLYNVLGDGLDVPFKIEQYLYGGRAGDEATNLLRVGGVYVLPLVKSVEQEYWGIYGDLGVLFEVDDKGLMHSHSSFAELNKYDGKPLSYLWQDIEYLSEHPLYHSWFAENISHGMQVEFVSIGGQEIVRLYSPDNGWDDADTEVFSALVENSVITMRTDAPPYNHFRLFEGMTKNEFLSAVDEIKAYLGMD
jgi:hypothetical protein